VMRATGCPVLIVVEPAERVAAGSGSGGGRL
jgi:hypothetical protein